MGGRIAAFAVAVVALAGAAPALAYDPAVEARNYSKTGERWTTLEANTDYQFQQLTIGSQNFADQFTKDAGSGGKRMSLTLCGTGFNGCAGDIRTYDYQGKKGVQVPFVFVNDNGAHLEGHMWASFRTLAKYQRSLKARARKKHRKPRKFPGVVIQEGSVQAPERIYWWAAQTLAAHDYIAMTFDVQGQGGSDTFGSGGDMFGGVPAQQPSVFTGDLENAIDFFESSAAAPYAPRKASAVPVQQSETSAGNASDYNPLSPLLDHSRLGIVGHSLAAYAVSVVQGVDKRVDAVVAWDNLGSGTGQPGSQPVKPRVPALGMSADYGLTPMPYTSDPDPQAKNQGFAAWRKAGLDSMQVNVRGGTHYEWSFISNPGFGATLRGMDMAGWYTTAWLDKYVKGDRRAVRRLLTNRWLGDAQEAAVDPDHDGNMYSFYFPSRIGFGNVSCDDLRKGCAALASDGLPPNYSVLNDR